MATKSKAKAKSTKNLTPECKVRGCHEPSIKYGYCEACREKNRRTNKKPYTEVICEFGEISEEEIRHVEEILLSKETPPIDETPIDDHLIHMTKVECLELRALDAEVRNTLQGMEIINRNIRERDLETSAFNRDQSHQKALLENFLTLKRREYNKVIVDLAAKYKLEKHQMAYDTETGILRDLRPVVEGDGKKTEGPDPAPNMSIN